MAEDYDQEFLANNHKVSMVLLDVCARSNKRSAHEVGEILNSQEALFASIKQRDYLKSAMHLSDHDAQLLEVKAIRQTLAITRKHGIPQSSLKSAVCLSKLSDQCTTLGINVEGAAKFDLANVLWDQGEMTASIQMLQQLKEQNDLHSQAVPISRAELLVTLVSDMMPSNFNYIIIIMCLSLTFNRATT